LYACGTAPKKSETPKFRIVETKLASGIKNLGDGNVLLDSTDNFTSDDDFAIAYVKFQNLSGKRYLKWEWYTPDGKLYHTTKNYPLKTSQDEYSESASVWHKIALKGNKAGNFPGKWNVKIYLDDAPIISKHFQLVPGKTTSLSAGLPPILSIEEISFSDPLLEVGETAELRVTIKNTGPGDANNLSLELYTESDGLLFESKNDLPILEKKNGIHTVSIPITGNMELVTGEASIDVQVFEPHFKVNIKGKRLTFNTAQFKNPELILARFAATESDSSSANQQIDINEILDLKVAIQNIGQGVANEVQVDVINNQNGVMFLGRGEGQNLTQEQVSFDKVDPGKHHIINYRYFVNSFFKEDELKFQIKSNEKYGKYGFTEIKPISINKILQPEGYIRKVALSEIVAPGAVLIEDIPELTVDVDVGIPITTMDNENAIAVVVGNRNYQHKDIPPVRFARRDAEIIRQYLIKTLGFKDGNVLFEADAAKSRFEALFGISGNHKGILHDWIKPNKSDVFIYYSGHGAPDVVDKQGYFLPVDCDPAKIALTGYSLETFYKNLSKMQAKKITIVLEACFSGGTNSGGNLIGSASPALIKVDSSYLKKGNATVLTSSEGDQISSWHDEKQHGLFTYFFLKAIRGDADIDKNNQITFREIYNFVSDRSEGVPYWSRRLHGGRIQVPTLSGNRDSEILVDLN